MKIILSIAIALSCSSAFAVGGGNPGGGRPGKEGRTREAGGRSKEVNKSYIDAVRETGATCEQVFRDTGFRAPRLNESKGLLRSEAELQAGKLREINEVLINNKDFLRNPDNAVVLGDVYLALQNLGKLQAYREIVATFVQTLSGPVRADGDLLLGLFDNYATIVGTGILSNTNSRPESMKVMDLVAVRETGDILLGLQEMGLNSVNIKKTVDAIHKQLRERETEESFDAEAARRCQKAA